MLQGFRWSQFIPSDTVIKLATLGPVGHWGKAPGTNGTFAGLLWYTVAFHHLSPVAYGILLLATLYVGVVLCGEAEVRMMKRDPGEVILDEFTAIPICFIGLQRTLFHLDEWAWTLILAGFLLFRFFDILKPLGIKKLQDLPGGWGVMLDDIAAAVATCICLHLGIRYVLPEVLRLLN